MEKLYVFLQIGSIIFLGIMNLKRWEKQLRVIRMGTN
jgi:hypothetical protein